MISWPWTHIFTGTLSGDSCKISPDCFSRRHTLLPISLTTTLDTSPAHVFILLSAFYFLASCRDPCTVSSTPRLSRLESLLFQKQPAAVCSPPMCLFDLLFIFSIWESSWSYLSPQDANTQKNMLGSRCHAPEKNILSMCGEVVFLWRHGSS